MTNKEKCEGFDFSQNPYEQEARERWGDEAVDKSNAKIKNLSKDEQKGMSEEFNDIYKRIAAVRHSSPYSLDAQTVIGEWYRFLNKKTGYHYSLNAFKGLGQMYVDDKRFTKNIDQFGDGVAQFMCDAMSIFADQNKNAPR